MEKIGLKYSYALKEFKSLAGQSNHFLITILIGLDAVENGDAKKSDDFKTSWNPKNVTSSARRSRMFSINATLAWLIDALDSYIIIGNRNPKIIQDENLKNAIDGAGRSVHKKVKVLKEHLNLTSVPSNMVEVAISWRNRLIHNFAKNDISEEIRNSLVEKESTIEENYSGLEISSLLDRFDQEKTPRFKEVTSLVRAVHNFVYEVDSILLSNLDLKKYLEEILKDHLNKNYDSSSNKTPNSRAGSIWSKNTFKQLKQIFQNYGLTTHLEEDDLKIGLEYIEKLSEHSPSEVINKYIN